MRLDVADASVAEEIIIDGVHRVSGDRSDFTVVSHLDLATPGSSKMPSHVYAHPALPVVRRFVQNSSCRHRYLPDAARCVQSEVQR